MYAFASSSSTMGWDASRVSAAIPSGVGFLGAASIWKGTKGTGEDKVPEVHGLTTATSVWLSAAIGILCGGALPTPRKLLGGEARTWRLTPSLHSPSPPGGLYVPCLFTAAAGVVYLRFAPRLPGSAGSLTFALLGDHVAERAQGDTRARSYTAHASADDLPQLPPLDPVAAAEAGASTTPRIAPSVRTYSLP